MNEQLEKLRQKCIPDVCRRENITTSQVPVQKCVPDIHRRENITTSKVVSVQQKAAGGQWSRSNQVHVYPATADSGSSTSRAALPEKKVLSPLVKEESTQVPVRAKQFDVKTAPYSLYTSMQKLKHSDDGRGPVRAACGVVEVDDGGSGGSKGL